MQTQTIETATETSTWSDVREMLRQGTHVIAWAHPDMHPGVLPAARLDDGPFRAPHHTCSLAAMLGSVRRVGESHAFTVYPGEVSLAHRGVLLLDDAPEFPLRALQGVAAAACDGHVEFWAPPGSLRGGTKIALSSACTVLAVAQPCPCGWLGHPERVCTCSPKIATRYAERLCKGLERIDAVGVTIGDKGEPCS